MNMPKAEPERIVICTLTRYSWLFLPMYFWADRLLLPDISILDAKKRGLDIEKFKKFLKFFSLYGKLDQGELYDFDPLRWRANSLAVRLLQKKYLGVHEKGLKRYFSYYLAHRRIDRLAKQIFFYLLVRQANNKDVSVFKDGQYFFLNHSCGLLRIMGLVLLPLFPVVLVLLMVRLIINKITITDETDYKEGGIAVDLIHGTSLTKENKHQPGVYSDSFFVDGSAEFSVKNHAFLDFGWPKEDFENIRSKIESSGGNVFGIRSFRPKLDRKDVLKIYLKSLGSWGRLQLSSMSFFDPKIQLLLIKFCFDLFQARLCFLQHRPSVYFSRMDYSYRHHVIGAACRELDVFFVGVCHSPLAGSGYAPQWSLVSFDTYFVYSSQLEESFFPAWKALPANLVKVGVWRSDLIHQIRQQPLYQKELSWLRAQLGQRFVVSLHLPVPQSYLFNKEVVSRWMEGFAGMITKHENVVFILFPRRLHQAPEYFATQLQKLLEVENCMLAEKVRPLWKQSYRWVLVSDMVIGCNYSDTVLEALSFGIPSLSYADTGMGRAGLERFDHSLSVYDVDSITACIEKAKNNQWPDEEQWKKIHDRLAPNADGKCIHRIKKEISPRISLVNSKGC